MDKIELLHYLQCEMNKVNSFILKVKDIKNHEKDAECISYINRAHSIKADIFRKINLYKNLDLQQFNKINQSLVIDSIKTDIKSLELSCNSLIKRGSIYIPNDPNKKLY